MTTKPLKIDWDLLEEAFSTQNEDLVYFLDLVTGHIHLEGEDTDDEEEYDDDGGAHVAIPQAPRRDDRMRRYIQPPNTALKIEWLDEFLPAVEKEHPEMAAKLREAKVEEDPAPKIGVILKEFPDGRDAWYLYRSVRVQQMIEEWLATNEVQVTDTPPWK